MNKGLTRKEKRSLVLISIICITVISVSIISSIDTVVDIYHLKKEKKELTIKLEDLKDEEKTLSDDVEKLKNPEYAARFAREKYLYSKNGEKILKID